MTRRFLLCLMTVMLFTGCASAPKIDLTAFVTDREPKAHSPDMQT